MREKNEGHCTECQHRRPCVGPIGLERRCPGKVNKEDIHEDYRDGFHGIFELRTEPEPQILTMAELKTIVNMKPDEGTLNYKKDGQDYFVSKLWYNEWILHVDLYEGTVFEGQPWEKWLVLQKDNLFDARRVTTDETEKDVIHAFGDILAVMNRGELHVYVEMFQGTIEEVKIFDTNEEWQKAYKAWKKGMEIEDEPVEEAFGDEGTAVYGFETKIE